jgi:hypothetical protein
MDAFVCEDVTHESHGRFGFVVSVQTHLLNTPKPIEAAQDVEVFHDSAGIVQWRIGHKNFATRQATELVCQTSFSSNQGADIEVVAAMQKLMCVDAMMANQTNQGGPIAFPIACPQVSGRLLIDR